MHINRRLIGGAYLTILIVLAVIFAAVSRHQKRFEIIFTYEVDYIFYETARALYQAKESIYEYEKNVNLLYHDKKKIFTKPVLTYETQFPRIWENVRYLEELLGKKIFTDSFSERARKSYQTLHQIHKVNRVTHTILTFRTLGIAKLFTV